MDSRRRGCALIFHGATIGHSTRRCSMKVALSLLIALSLFACSSRWEGEAPIEMQFRVARERAAEGLTPMPIEGSRVRLYLREQVLLTNADLKSAAPGVEDDKPVVVLRFTRKGGMKLEDVTRENKGQRMAVVLDSVLVSAPRITDVLESSRAVIHGDFDRADVEAIARRLMPQPVAAAE
jgi:hypothetical protein